jgi:hypothetical protein
MADVTLSVVIPDAHVNTILQMLTEFAGKTMVLKAGGVIEWPFTFVEKQAGETNRAFAERYIKTFIRASARLYSYTKDAQRHASETLAITKPTQSIPDTIVG